MGKHVSRVIVLGLLILVASLCASAAARTDSAQPEAALSSGSTTTEYSIIFDDGFDGGNTSLWNLAPGWTAVEEGGDWHLQAAPNGGAGLVSPLIRADYRFRVDLRLSGEGWAGLSYRQGSGQYLLEVMENWLYMGKFDGTQWIEPIAQGVAPIPLDQWRTVEISGTVGHIQVLVDDVVYLDLEDPDPVYAGSIGLNVFDNPAAHVDFDNVQVLVAGVEQPPWIQTNGPEGAPMDSIVIHPANSEVLFASGSGGGVYKSTDAGESWLLSRIPEIGLAEQVYDLVIDPTAPNTLYALAQDSIWKTTDGGVSWESKVQGIDPCHRNLRHLVMDASNSDTLYVGTHTHCPETIGGALYRSADGGATWINISHELDMPVRGGISALDVTGPNMYVGIYDYASIQEGGLYYSSDNGGSWSAVDFGQPADTYVFSVFVDPTNADEVWVGLHSIYNILGSQVLFVTMDGGATWNPVPGFPGSEEVTILGKSPSGVLYVASNFHCRTADNGLTWEVFIENYEPDTTGGPNSIAFNPDNEDILYVALRWGSGLAKSTDGGNSWYRINAGLVNTSVSLLAAHPTEPTTLYAAAVSGDGTFKTVDRGLGWTWLTGRGITHPWADELVISPHDPQTVWYVADVAQVFETEDGGVVWAKIIDPYGEGFRFGSTYAVAPAPSDPDTLYALKNGFGIFKTSDAGNGWQFLHQSEIDYTYSIAVHPTDPDIVYSGHNPKPFQDWAMVRQSTDGGLSWRTALSIPHASSVTSVVIDPGEPDTVYAGSTGEGGKVWVSQDAGDSWDTLNDAFTFTNIHVMTADPGNSEVAYAGVWGGGTYRTTDGGDSWKRLPNDPTISASAILVHPSDSDMVYLADRTAPRIYRSTDGGATWETWFDAGPGYYRVLSAALAPGSPDVVYASIFSHGGPMVGDVFRIEGGIGAPVPGTLPRLPVALTVDPADGETAYAVLHGYGVYKTTDGGDSWTDISGTESGLPQSPEVGFNGLVVDPGSPEVLYLFGGCDVDVDFTHSGAAPGDMNTVYKSEDGGATWTNLDDGHLGASSSSIKGLAIAPADPDVLYVGALNGTLLSEDGGVTWTDISAGLAYTHTAGIALSSDGTHLYAPTLGGGVYAGEVNAGTRQATWPASSYLTATIHHVQVAVDPSDSQTLYASAYPGGTFKSVDSGRTWAECNFGMASFEIDDPSRQGYYAFAIAPSDPDVLYLGLYGVGIYKSTDGAGTWQPMNGSPPTMRGKHITSLLIDPVDPGVVYVSTENGVYRTTDGGEEWANVSTGLNCLDLRVLAMGSDGRLYAGSRGYEVYTYDDQVPAWRQMNAFGNFGTLWPIWDNRPLYQYTSLVFHPTDPDLIYFGTFPAGIFKSTDGGQSWRESNTGWTNDGVFSLVFHPEDADTIYAGTYNGVNRSTDAGAHWEIWDEGWPDEQWVFSIDFDPRDPNVMYACSKNGENEGRGRDGFHGTVMKSLDGGASWFSITTGLDVEQEFYKIIVDKNRPDTVYLATQHQGVFISHDGGEFWFPWNEGLTNPIAGANGNNVTNTMVQSADGAYIYFGTAGSGVFRRLTVTLDQPVYIPLILRTQL